jgi:hypothetical protein
VYWKALDAAVWELGEGFKEFPEADLWLRPHPKLLSVGELAAHVGYWEGFSFLGPDHVSPLNQSRASYYLNHVESPFSLDLTPEQVYTEVKSIHERGKAQFFAEPRDLDASSSFRTEWSWRTLLEYQAFHVAYHTGQIYTVRHLLGHQTVDN